MLKVSNVFSNLDPQGRPTVLLHKLLNVLGPLSNLEVSLEPLLPVRDQDAQSLLGLLWTRQLHNQRLVHSRLDRQQARNGTSVEDVHDNMVSSHLSPARVD
jgi:hypothetical protein